MARSRQVRPEFFTDVKLSKVSRDARLFFVGLWVEADDEGRLIDSPKMLAGSIFPHDDDVTVRKADVWLNQLIALGVLQRYEVDGDKYLFLTNFSRHQKVPHASPSKLPPPPLMNASGDFHE